MSWLRRNPLALVLALAAIALVAVLAVEIAVRPGDAGEVASKRGMAPEAKLLPSVAPVSPEQAYAETTARPIFVPTRRPAPPVQTVAAPAIQRGQFTLQGVIIVGNNKTAMLREKSNGKIHRVETGREINGMKVTQIDPTQVVIGIGEELEVVPLTVQRPGAPAAVPGAPAPLAAGGGPFAAPAPASPFPAQGGPTAGATAPAAGPPGFARGFQGNTAAAPGAPAAPAAAPAAAPGAPGNPNNPQATTAPMTPEELLARRRARRAQQNQ